MSQTKPPPLRFADTARKRSLQKSTERERTIEACVSVWDAVMLRRLNKQFLASPNCWIREGGEVECMLFDATRGTPDEGLECIRDQLYDEDTESVRARIEQRLHDRHGISGLYSTDARYAPKYRTFRIRILPRDK